MRRAVSIIFSLILTLSLAFPAYAEEEITFSDVSRKDWFYEAVTEMTSGEYRLFNGTATPVDGVGTFEPNAPISRIQFLAVITRYLYPEALDSAEAQSPWYRTNYRLAVEHGVISAADYPFNPAFLNSELPRQEMAAILIKSVEEKGEKLPAYSILESYISDYPQISEKYREAVKTTYTMGLVVGNGGGFNPLGSLTRAEATQVIYRLIKPSVRLSPENGGEREFNITFASGEAHPPAAAGDVLKTAAGREVELVFSGKVSAPLCGADGKYYDYISGTIVNGKEYRAGDPSWFDGTTLIRDNISGAVFSRNQWEYLQNALYPKGDGIQIGETRNTWYIWGAPGSGIAYSWQWIGPAGN